MLPKSRAHEITEIESVRELLAQGRSLAGAVVVGLDLRDAGIDWSEAELDVTATVFLGCEFADPGIDRHLVTKGATIFPRFSGLPYNPYRPTLYTADELTASPSGDPADSLDERVKKHYNETTRNKVAPILEALAQRVHDHAVEDALEELLAGTGGQPRKVVGIMGGHRNSRIDSEYRTVAVLARLLTIEGYFVATGGGPGIMEAGNLGAYLAPYGAEAIEEALRLIKDFPTPGDDYSGYVRVAKMVRERYPNGAESLAVPTWLYENEPTSAFATHIAKFFQNSVREDGLLAIARYGVAFGPGSAGTLQEIFADASQNAYHHGGFRSPMVFLASTPMQSRAADVVRMLAEEKQFSHLVAIETTAEEAAEFIKAHPPEPMPIN